MLQLRLRWAQPGIRKIWPVESSSDDGAKAQENMACGYMDLAHMWAIPVGTSCRIQIRSSCSASVELRRTGVPTHRLSYHGDGTGRSSSSTQRPLQEGQLGCTPLRVSGLNRWDISTFCNSCGIICAAAQHELDAAGERVTGLVKYVVKDLDMRGSVEDASRYLPGLRAEAAKRHGFESFEYMGQIVEFTGYDELKKPGISRFALLTSPDRVDFARKCLDAAGRELDAFFGAFDRDAIAQAKEIYAAYFGPPPS